MLVAQAQQQLVAVTLGGRDEFDHLLPREMFHLVLPPFFLLEKQLLLNPRATARELLLLGNSFAPLRAYSVSAMYR
jgi:hypothetical protein